MSWQIKKLLPGGEGRGGVDRREVVVDSGSASVKGPFLTCSSRAGDTAVLGDGEHLKGTKIVEGLDIKKP